MMNALVQPCESRLIYYTEGIVVPGKTTFKAKSHEEIANTWSVKSLKCPMIGSNILSTELSN